MSAEWAHTSRTMSCRSVDRRPAKSRAGALNRDAGAQALKIENQNVGRSAQSTTPSPANHNEKSFSRGRSDVHFPILGRLSRETRLGQDTGRQHNHRSTSKTRRCSGPGAGDGKTKIRYDNFLYIFHTPFVQFKYIRYYMRVLGGHQGRCGIRL